MAIVKNVSAQLTKEFLYTGKYFDSALESYIEARLIDNWTISVANQNRGFCRYHDKQIVIPVFALNKDIGYCTWYTAHELAHSYAGHIAKHGPIFQDYLKMICPEQYQWHEYSYKPKLAMRCNVSLADIPLEELL